MGIIRIATAALALTITAGCGAGGAAEATSPAGAAPLAASQEAPPTASAVPSAAPGPEQNVALPTGVAAGVAVYDRQAAAFTVQHNVEQRFRSASLVKLLIAIDYLWTRESVDAAERQRLDLMLSRSDDNAASHFYNLGGRTAIIARMNQRLGITVVPPTAPRTGWGSTEVSAAHLVRVYRYLLDEAPARVGQYIVGRLRKGAFTKCGADGYDQSFGIPSAFPGLPWAAKQGWYEFAAGPKDCVSAAPAALVPAALVPAAGPVDWSGESLHSTGIVGPNDRSIVVVLTSHPRGTPYAVATMALTRLAASLRLTA